MPVRYYPNSKIIPNLKAEIDNFYTRDGKPYNGLYYSTYDGQAFTGPNPQIGPNEPLFKKIYPEGSPFLEGALISNRLKKDFLNKTGIQTTRIQGRPTPYYPSPTEADYRKGYVIRYFTKKENEKGYVIEISEEEYNEIQNGTAEYDIKMYQTTKILWKITGPLNSQRKSQYNIIPGIIETNQRLTETANKTFLGITDFIGGDYTKFAKPTA